MYQALINIKELYIKIKNTILQHFISKTEYIVYNRKVIPYLNTNFLGFCYLFVSSFWYLIFLLIIGHDIWSFYLIILILFFSILFAYGLLPKWLITFTLGLSTFYYNEGKIFLDTIFSYALITVLFIGSFYNIIVLDYIRILFFFKCFIPYIVILYKLFPSIQKRFLDHNLIIDSKVIDSFHRSAIPVQEYFKNLLDSGQITKEDYDNFIKKYDTKHK